MEWSEFQGMVARLEARSREAPASYQARVALLALLGFVILAFIVGAASAAMLALAAIPFALWFGGVHAWGALLGLGKLLLLLVVPLWFFVRSSLAALLARLPAPQGVALQRREAPVLFAALDTMRHRMNGPRFHHVLLSEDLNAAVVQRPLFGLFGFPRNYLIVGLPLLESLSPDEALAVVAHEYGHLAGSHGRFAAFIYRLRSTWSRVHETSQQWTGMAGSALRRVVAWYAPYFNAYTFVLARANEYQADAAAARLVGVDVAVSALKRVDISGAHFGRFMQQAMREMAHRPAPPEDLATRWAAVAHDAPVEDAERWLRRALAVEGGVADTHPPLRERLRALQGDVATAGVRLPARVPGLSAAAAWLGDHADAVRQRMTSQWRERVAEPWKHHYDEAQSQRRQLDELMALAAPTQDQHAERLRLRLACDADDGCADDLAAFVAAYPKNALGPYLEGAWRLSKGDESGLVHLEQAIELDADVTKPACERAYAWLVEREDARAPAWQQRWRDRDQWETDIGPQLQQLDVHHELQDPDLDEEQLATIRAVMQAQRAGIARAWLARRILPKDPAVRTYVLALELEPAPPRVEMAHDIVERVASGGTWPVHVIVCVLEGARKALEPRLRALPRAAIGLDT